MREEWDSALFQPVFLAPAAAVFAGGQIWLSRRDANRRSTLDFLRQLDERLQDVWSLDTSIFPEE